MTKGKDAKKDAKKKPKASPASGKADTINMLNQPSSKKKKQYN